MQSFFDMGKGEYQIMTNLTKYEMEMVVNVMKKVFYLQNLRLLSYKKQKKKERGIISMPNNENKQKSRLMRERRVK